MTGPLRPVGNDIWRQPGRMSCPACGYAPDALGCTERNPVDPRAPETGDWSICIECGVVSVIVVHPLLGASLRTVTAEELAEFAKDPANVAAARRMHRPGGTR